MLKPLHLLRIILSTVSILVATETSISHPLLVGIRQQVSSDLNIDEPVCYMQTTDGRTWNLNRLCQAVQSPLVTISDIKYNDNFVSGWVINQSNKTVHNVKISYQVLDENGKTERQSIDTEPQTLNPKQSATFETVIPAGVRMEQISVTWNEQK